MRVDYLYRKLPVPWDSCCREELFQQLHLAMVSDAVIVQVQGTSAVPPPGSLPRKWRAADATTFIYQLENFKQKRKDGLTLGSYCTGEVSPSLASETVKTG